MWWTERSAFCWLRAATTRGITCRSRALLPKFPLTIRLLRLRRLPRPPKLERRRMHGGRSFVTLSLRMCQPHRHRRRVHERLWPRADLLWCLLRLPARHRANFDTVDSHASNFVIHQSLPVWAPARLESLPNGDGTWYIKRQHEERSNLRSTSIPMRPKSNCFIGGQSRRIRMADRPRPAI